MSFIHLHTHSDYSPQDGAQSCDMIAAKAAKLGMNSVALTDHGRAGGLLNFKKACEKNKIKPIYGTESYIAPSSRTLKEKIENFKPQYHLVLLAKNIAGLKNIFQLSSIGWKEGFYYKPRIDLTSLRNHSEGLVCLSGCGSGMVSQMLSEGREQEARAYSDELYDIFRDDFYLEVQNHGLEWQLPLKQQIFTLSKNSGYPIVATQDSHYQDQKDSVFHSAICKLAAGNLQFESDQSYFKSEKEMKEMFDEEEWHSIYRTQEVADKCNCNWEFGKTIWPVYDLPYGVTPEQELRQKTLKGFNRLFPNPTEEYTERLNYELGIITDMGFPTYFLVVADFINWAENNEVYVGAGRGSGAGSLVCFALNITKIDPIKYGLYFERFLNPSRISLPDIDIDLEPIGRKRVMKYVYEKYGEEKCAQIGTYAVFKPRGSLRDFARALGYPVSVGEQLSKLVPPDVTGKSLSFEDIIKDNKEILDTEYNDVIDIARRAEKLVSQAGVHAAGVVISNIDISTQVPLFKGKHDEIATQFDMHDVEEIGLVKYDFLGLKNLTVVHGTIDLVKEYKNIEIDINKIDKEDQNVFNKIFQKGNLDGIFQFETSSGFRDLCIKIKPKSIEDLSIITALFRPGPLTARGTNGKTLVEQYVDGRNGERVQYLFPELEPILKDTYSVMVFQEQIMRICTDCAGYTLAEADNMRKIIGKKLPEKMKLEKEKLVSGCVSNGIDKKKAEQLFQQIEGFAAYSFNAAHSVAYSTISYQTAWLKTYYPEEFYCSLLNNSLKDQGDMVKYIHALKKEEIPIMPPDVNISSVGFTVADGTIVFGLAGIKGIGEKVCLNLVDSRPQEGFQSISDLVKHKIGKGVISSLAMCGALEEISDDISREQIVANIEELVKFYKKEQKIKERKIKIGERLKEIELWEQNPEGPKPRRLPGINEKQIPVFPVLEEKEISKREKLNFERKTLGFYLSGHPMDNYPGLSQKATYTVNDILEGKAQDSEVVHLPVVVSSITERRTKKGKNMATLIVEDKSGRIEITIFPRQWPIVKNILEENSVYVLKCKAKIEQQEDNLAPIVGLILNTAYKIDQNSDATLMHMIKFKLEDETIISFVPQEQQNYSKWQQALAFVKNIKRMG